ncbi:hypothetical protein CC78DRAFT_618176 [Lojkania enalia]|uniref:Uncharacterized protein n=1 Tax=Lojkania enalia TaxID=147567 RepID=A0A9P4K6S0_9PLEO|nr:hypothetical protein CC78DRAFT_618176 [Didymosphaeria enalia]
MGKIMTSPSPSEFLTFYRRLSTYSSLHQSILSSHPSSIRLAQTAYARHFAFSSRLQKDENYPEDPSTNDYAATDRYPASDHATKKAREGNHHDVQTANLKDAQHSAKETNTGGHATEQRDSAGGKAKAKQEFPEAPDPAIGMQDERGGRGA